MVLCHGATGLQTLDSLQPVKEQRGQHLVFDSPGEHALDLADVLIDRQPARGPLVDQSLTNRL
jgi:hypothetical protein